MERSTLRDEVLKCGRDPAYFIENYVQIQHPVRGLIPFRLFDYQQELVQNYESYRFNIILKARQLGISEITSAYCVWLMLFHRDKNILVMASKADTAKNIVRKVQTAFANLPKWMMLARVITDNKLSVELDNGSRIKCVATAKDAGRSEALSLLIVDEAAFVQRLDTLWTGLYPTVQAGGAVIVMSTPNGVGNKFHSLYVDAENDLNEFHATKLMWWRHPEHVLELRDDDNRPGFKTSPWYKNEIASANMSPREVAQELECNFNASGDTVVGAEQLALIEKNCVDPISMENVDRKLFVWARSRPGVKYLLVADVARGDGRDNSAAHMFEAQTMDQVAEYYAKTPVEDFAKMLVSLGREYNNALLVIENNNHGLACLEHVRLANYESVYYSHRGDNKPGEVVNSNWGPTRPDEFILGFTTSPKNRPLIFSKFEEYVRNHQMNIRSRRFHNELKTFIWHNGRPEAAKGSNDDLVMAGAIGAWIRETFLMPSLGNAESQKKMLDGIGMDKRVNTQIAGASKDPRFVSQRTMGIFPTVEKPDPLRVRLPNGRVADFHWLLDEISRG